MVAGKARGKKGVSVASSERLAKKRTLREGKYGLQVCVDRLVATRR